MMKLKRSTALGLTAALVMSALACAKEPSSKGVISRLITYTNFGNGDVFISLPTNGAICTYGYYMNKDSLGYQASLSMLLAAYQAKTPVKLTGNESNRWTGSGNPVCELYSVEYKR
jgi:hypothetical protein